MANKDNKEKDDEITVGRLMTSLCSIAAGAAIGYLASEMFDWTMWICIVIGVIVGWAAPGFIEGACETLKEGLQDED